MTSEFIGKAEKLKDDDFKKAATSLSCEEAAIRSVTKVESSGSGFFSDGSPKILFESHKFHEQTKGEYDQSHPNLSTSRWVRNYYGGKREYDRLHEAITLDKDAALKSTSWGMFQIMGFNYKISGYDSVEEFVNSMLESEGHHLQAFLNFVKHNHLDGKLREQDWANFARGYNGASYKKNHYDTKLKEAYTLFSVQMALNNRGIITGVDGMMGPNTRRAIKTFQTQEGLTCSGVAGPSTLQCLGIKT